MSGVNGVSVREKGKRNERTVARKIREAIPELVEEVRRGWQTRLGSDAADITGLPGFWVETKCGKKPDMRAAYKQAKSACKNSAWPIAVIQDDGSTDRMVVLPLSVFLRILRSAYGFVQPLKFGVQGNLFAAPEHQHPQSPGAWSPE